MDLLSFIQTVDPTKVRIGERQHAEGEPNVDKLLTKDWQRVVMQSMGDSVICGHGVGVRQVSETCRNEREDWDQNDFWLGQTSETITAPPRFVISSDSSHHSGANIAEAEVDSFARPFASLMTMTTTVTSTVNLTTTAKEKFVEPSIFGGGSSSGAEHTVGGFSGLTGSDFIVGDIRTVVSHDTDLQKFAPPKFFASIRGMEHDELFTEFNVRAARQISLSAEVRMRAEFNIREKRRLSVVVEEKDSLLKARDEEVASLKSQLLVKEAEAAEAIRLRAKVQALADRNTVLEGERGERRKFHNATLSDQVHKLEVSSAGLQENVTAYENFIGQLEKFQDDRMWEMNENFDKLDTDLVEVALYLAERFYPHLLTTIFGRRWLLTHGLELAIAKCLNSTEYLSSLGAAIGKAVEKGMQEGLSAGITHGEAGRVLTDVVAYNPSAEADYLSAFLAERLGLTESQPRVDQLMVPIHHSPDQRVVGASALSLWLDVSSSRVQRIRENIANHRSALHDVFVPLYEPLSATALTGTEVISATIDTPIAPFTTLFLVRTITPISIEDYEVAGTDGQEAVNENVPNDTIGGNVLITLPMLMMVELNVSQ
ncbi:hypothetical protein Tco_0291671 [Tanacetum coccineum]